MNNSFDYKIMITPTQNKELDVLSYIGNHNDATQRQISEHLGISLGTINIVLKRLVTKGLVKIERLQPNSVKYFLTPAGITNKIERTYGYIVRTYREVESLSNRIVAIANHLAVSHSTEIIQFYGPKDDFSNLVRDLASMNKFTADVAVIHSIKELDITSAPIIVWKEETEKSLTSTGIHCVNIMEIMTL
jgi:predicted ArsR family transcriptional regulator